MPVVDGTGIGQVRLGVLADIVGRDGVGREPVAVRWMEDSPHQPRPHRLMWLSLMQRLVTESSSRKVPFVMSTGILILQRYFARITRSGRKTRGNLAAKLSGRKPASKSLARPQGTSNVVVLTTFPRREEQDMFPCQPQKGG